MAVRKEIAQRKLELARNLRQASLNCIGTDGEMLPTTRELAERYGVSVRVVTQELQKLVAEGVLHTVPRVGTFAGRQFSSTSDYYLMLQHRHKVSNDSVRIGFEERVAAIGGSSLIMPLDMALEQRHRGELPPLCGVFDFSYYPGDAVYWEEMAGVPTVCFIPPGAKESAGHALPERQKCDEVHFDDMDGGRQATQHLLRLGHRKIAFLGLHDGKHTPGMYSWSEQREAGWRAAMEQAGHDLGGMSFHPSSEPKGRPHHTDRDSEVQAATEAARALVRDETITAVVAANDYAALGLFAALREAKVPGDCWPCVVGFDDLPQAQSYVLTSLRLPWEEIGKAAVDLLWERKEGRLNGPPQERYVKMHLISRLTSRQNWSQGISHTTLSTSLL